MRSLFLALFVLAGCSQVGKIHGPKREKKFFHVRWAKNLDFNYLPGNLPLSYGGVASGADTLFVGALDGSFRAVDEENGRELWRHLEGKSIAAPALVHEDLVYYGTQGGRLVVRQAVDGELKYAIDLGAPIEAAAVWHDGRLIIYLRGHQIVCLDAVSGKIIWNYRRAVPITVTLQRTTKPLVVDNRIIVGFADGYAGALSLAEGTLIWEQRLVETQKFVDVDLDPILVDGLVVTGSPSGELKALDPKDGAIRRQFSASALSNPMVRGQTLLFGNAHGEISFIGMDGKVIKEARVTRDAINQLWWWKDHIVVATFGGELLAVDPLNLQVVERFPLGHSQSSIYGQAGQDSQGLGILTSRSRLFFFE